MREPRSLRRGFPEIFAVLSLIALAAAARALGFEFVFIGDHVVFPPADAQYHLRRAFYTFENFPSLLLFDPYINYPGGASVPWPPLYDLALASAARLLARGSHGFEVVAAWTPVALSASAIVPIHLAGRRLDSAALGLVAGLCYALLPINVWFARVGNADHHAAVALIGAWLLLAWLRALDPGESRRGVWSAAGLLFAARSCLLLTWHGSLLYLAIADGLLLATAALRGHRAILQVELWSSLACAALLAPILLLLPPPLGGAYSAIALSWLHLLTLVAVAVIAAGLLAADERWPGRSAAERFGTLLLLGAAFLLVLCLFPGPRAGLEPALEFLTLADGFGDRTGEQFPLFRLRGRMVGLSAVDAWGFYAYLIPLAPLAAWWLLRRPGARRAARASALPLAAWGAAFGALTISQQRYGNDFAPAAALLFGVALLGLGRAVAAPWWAEPGRTRAGAVIASLMCVSLFAPTLVGFFGPRLASSLTALRSGEPPLAARLSVAATLSDFCREVRRLTPDTAAFLEPGPAPEYGILAPANIGHALHYRGHRATATDPFWAYIGRENWNRSLAFRASRSERAALALAAALRGRFVVTVPGEGARTVVGQLHNRDGRAIRGRGALSHFRLLTEGPLGAASIQAIYGHVSRDLPPYKLFEIVRGAELEVRAEPGRIVTASVELVTPPGRRFRYRNRAFVREDGTARVVLPYPTDRRPRGPGSDGGSGAAVTEALQPYRVAVGAREQRLQVSAAAVRDGERIQLDLREAAGE